MDSHELVKRHGSPIHVEVANVFALVASLLLVLYSATALLGFKRVIHIVQRPVVLVIAWSALCIAAIFWHFQANALQIARRYGQLSIASATLSVFLSLKPAPLPRTYHASLASIHKWVGRSCILFALIHGTIYSISFMKQSNSAKRHEEEEHTHKPFSTFNIFGMISLFAFVVILISSLKFFRRRAYAVFYGLHRPLVILVFVLMIWHARPSSPVLIGFGLAMLIAQLIARALLTARFTVSKVETFGSNLQLVHFNCDSGLLDISRDQAPGTYLRVSRPLFSPVQFFRPSHPYTLAGNGKLVVRESRFKISETGEYCTYGPFHGSLDLNGYNQVLLIAGGSGISMAPSVVQSQPRTKLVWVTRDASEADILPHLGLANCNLYVTSTAFKDPEEDLHAEEEYELEDREEDAGLLASGASSHAKGFHKYKGRPHFNELVASFEPQEGPLLVIACGPESLVNDASRWASSKKISFWSEVYAL